MKLINGVVQVFIRLGLLIIPVAIVIYFLLATHAGLITTVNIASKLTSAKLSYEKIDGTLWEGIEANHVTYQTNELKAVVNKINIRWDLSHFNHEVIINELSLQQADIETVSSGATHEVPNLKWLTYFNFKKVTIKDLKINKNEIASLDIHQIDPKHFQLELSSTAGKVTGDYTVEYLPQFKWKAHLQGQHINPAVYFAGAKGDIAFTLNSQGKWNTSHQQINLQLNELTGTLQNYPLSAKGLMTYQNGNLNIDSAVLRLANAESTIKGSLSKNWNLSWQIEIPELNVLNTNVGGRLYSKGMLTGKKEQPIINASFNAKNISFKDYTIPQMRGTVGTQVYKEGLQTQLSLNLDPQNQLHGSLTMANAKLDGVIAVDFKNINRFLKNDNIKNLHGNLGGDIKISGSIDQPEFDTQLNLAQGGFDVPSLGLKLNSMALRAVNKNDGPIQIDGNLRVGEGQAYVKGQIAPENSNWKVDCKLTGTNLTVADLKEYKIIINPNINVRYSDDVLMVSGLVEVPKAQINSPVLNDTITLPSEVEIVNADNTSSTDLPADLALQLQINLGKDIGIIYNNLTASLGGSIAIAKKPMSFAVATGELFTKQGRYKAYGKELTIDTGRLIYTGNALTNPGLNIRAVKKIQTVSVSESTSQFRNNADLPSNYAGNKTIQVGVSVLGTLKKPKISLYSDEGLNQEDILSYLVFGYPRAQISKGSSIALLNMLAMNSLGSSGGGGIKAKIDKLQNSLGLSEMNIGQTTFYDPKNGVNNATTVSVGKQIGKKLYVRYSYGITDALQILNLRYQLNKHLSVQSETSSLENGADIFYEIER